MTPARLAPLLFLLAAHAIAGAPLPRSTPEAQGVPSAAIREFVESAHKTIHTLHSFMLVRHGHVIAEGWWKPESAEKPHVLWSLSKSFTSTAVGLAAAEGKLRVDDPVLKFFPSETPADASENLKAMRVRDLLSMSGGHDTEPKFKIEDGPSVKAIPRASRPARTRHLVPLQHARHLHALGDRHEGHGPDACSIFSNHACSSRSASRTPSGARPPRVSTSAATAFSSAPRTSQNSASSICKKESGTANNCCPKNGSRTQPPSKWTTTRRRSGMNPDWRQGYGYQFWRCQHNAFRGDGRDGQICLVMPEQDAVIAITAKTGQMQTELDLVWEKLLPAFQKVALPANPAEQEKLKQTLAALAVREGNGADTLPGAR